VPPGLYVLLIVRREDSRLFDWQMNAVYASAESERFSFVAAADSQWGDLPEVASAVIGFVALMNASARAGTGPEFIVVAGDIVDCQFGSANSARSKLLGGACDYGRDYVQAWLAFAALRVPIHMTPGNHDGYRFVDAVGATSSDGLFL
jgi:hypothetical protein